MKADRELDARIDAEIFGVERKLCTIHHAYSCCGRTTKHYSTQIADAWLVAEKLAKGNIKKSHDHQGCWIGYRHDRWFAGFSDYTTDVIGANTAPLAICLAALTVVERRGR